jgi:ribonuclease-3
VVAGTLMDDEIEEALGHRFREPGLLTRALTHASYAHEHPAAAHNERLAFLGDAVLGLVVAELVSDRARDAAVGGLTVERARLVSGPSLAGWAARLGLPARLRLGRGEALGGGAAKESILATAFEAMIGALYLEAGLGAVTSLVRRLLDCAPPETERAAPAAERPRIEGCSGSC